MLNRVFLSASVISTGLCFHFCHELYTLPSDQISVRSSTNGLRSSMLKPRLRLRVHWICLVRLLLTMQGKSKTGRKIPSCTCLYKVFIHVIISNVNSFSFCAIPTHASIDHLEEP